MRIGRIDLSQQVFVIAELSANHGGSLDRAMQSIQAAKAAGADAIKLQTYTPQAMTLDSYKSDFVVQGGTPWDGQRLFDLYQRAQTPYAWHKPLFEYARSLDLEVFSSPFDTDAVDFLKPLDPCAYKIASFEVTDHALIRHVAKQHKPIIISTGIATLEELQSVLDICHEVGNAQIALLQCTSAYPAPLQEANLKTIADMADRFGVVAGFSDHTLGIIAPVVAVSLGARVIEKHFMLEGETDSPDASFSLKPDAFAQMVQAIRQAEQLLGRATYDLSPQKAQNRQLARSLYVVRPIKKGECFTPQNLKALRPFGGVHPKHLDELLGREAQRDYAIGDAPCLTPKPS